MPAAPTPLPLDGTPPGRLSRRSLRDFRAFGFLLTGRRILFVSAICWLVSTQALFQPSLYQGFSLHLFVSGWLDYLGECLLMSLPMMLALTLAEAAMVDRSRMVGVSFAVIALIAGACAGAGLLIPYYDLPIETAFDRRFVGDMIYWIAIAGGVATMYGLQQRATAAAAAVHRAEVDRVALSKQLLEAQLQVMRAQIEPHFLFNTLANV